MTIVLPFIYIYVQTYSILIFNYKDNMWIQFRIFFYIILEKWKLKKYVVFIIASSINKKSYSY